MLHPGNTFTYCIPFFKFCASSTIPRNVKDQISGKIFLLERETILEHVYSICHEFLPFFTWQLILPNFSYRYIPGDQGFFCSSLT